MRRKEVLSNKTRSMAVLVADVSFARFGFLPRVLQVHGATAARQFSGVLRLDRIGCTVQVRPHILPRTSDYARSVLCRRVQS